MLKRGIYSLKLISLLILSSCTLLTPRQEPLRDETSITTLRSLKATATIRMVRKSRLDFRGRALIIVQHPDLFRIELLGPFNQTAFIMTGDGERLSLFDVGKSVLHRWPANRGPYPFTGTEIVSSLLGTLPEAPGNGNPEGGEIIEGSTEGGKRSFLREDSAKRNIRIDLEDFRSVSGVPLPFTISMASPLGRLSIRYKAVTLNVDTGSIDFTLPAPAGVNEVYDQ
ncbi:MAG: hypothetical protein ACE5GF_05465 [Thermodesulfobacteriota bacterium]